MAKTWDVSYKNARTGEWTFLANYHGRTAQAAIKAARANWPAGGRELRAAPGPDRPTPKRLFTMRF